MDENLLSIKEINVFYFVKMTFFHSIDIYVRCTVRLGLGKTKISMYKKFLNLTVDSYDKILDEFDNIITVFIMKEIVFIKGSFIKVVQFKFFLYGGRGTIFTSSCETGRV